MTGPSQKAHAERRLVHCGPPSTLHPFTQLALLLVLALVMVTATGCSQTAVPAVPAPLTFMSPHAFFNGELSDNAVLYLPYFYAAQEGPIHDTPTGIERYRFTWLRTFDAPVTVRLDAPPDATPSLIAKVLSGQGGYAPGEIVERKAVSLRLGQWERFQRLLNEADFWNDNGHQPEPGLDGAQWILEGARGGRYHVVARWSPVKQNRVFADVCLYAVELAGLNIKEDRVY